MKERQQSTGYWNGVICREAQQKYVEYVTKLSPQWVQGGEELPNTTEESSTSSHEERGFGRTVSSMKIGYFLN